MYRLAKEKIWAWFFDEFGMYLMTLESRINILMTTI